MQGQIYILIVIDGWKVARSKLFFVLAQDLLISLRADTAGDPAHSGLNEKIHDRTVTQPDKENAPCPGIVLIPDHETIRYEGDKAG